MANLLLFVFNAIAALIALVFTILWFIPNLLVRGLRKLVGADS